MPRGELEGNLIKSPVKLNEMRKIFFFVASRKKPSREESGKLFSYLVSSFNGSADAASGVQ